MMSGLALPQLPAPHKELARYIAEHPDTLMEELLRPYREYEAELRRLYAQDAENTALQNLNLNILPLFTDDSPGIQVRARDLAAESEQQKQQYIMALPDDQRRPGGSPAVVKSLKEFHHNFNVFSESSLGELDWSNVVAAGSSVVNCLLPVPEHFRASKRTLREFYHERFCPASDVDLFLYGLTEDEAVEKIRQIEAAVRDGILAETTTVRTKHAITICSEYPTRHIQIVLRIYKDISEILTGFDVDCSASAYDGKQVYCTPRALESYITQVNRIDLSRRSPSYESRLSKYSHRGFEVHWTDLDRSRIDPTIFERSFKRTLGLARLLVLERLPTSSARDQYLAMRRQERGRPPLEHAYFHRLGSNIKDSHEDEIADWVNEDEMSNYHTFTLPYGVKYPPKKIEKLCYTRDLLLNAEWNQPGDRKVYLHRHPAFFGRVDDVINDCCGFCPKPETDEERGIYEEESKIYVSGRMSFIQDDPGRQQIGSFNPLSAADWTDMAYVGNTARLCQDIVDGELEHVQDWLAQESADPNTRDYTGRTPLHLAVMQSTPEIVKALIDRGARLVARLADGRTALHLAAERGNVEIVKLLLDKSVANEAEEEQKRAQKKNAKSLEPGSTTAREKDAEDSEDSDVDMMDEPQSDDGDQRSTTTGSFVHVNNIVKEDPHRDAVPEENQDDPDFYDINVVAWDTPCSALQFAVLCGHEEVVQLLCQVSFLPNVLLLKNFFADLPRMNFFPSMAQDILLPVKFQHNNQASAVLLSLVLPAKLSAPQAKSMMETMLNLGATCAQADMHGFTAFHRLLEQNVPLAALLDLLVNHDNIGVQNAFNQMVFTPWGLTLWPLKTAIERGDSQLVLQLLDAGAAPQLDINPWLKAARQSCIEPNLRQGIDSSLQLFQESVDQPIVVALQCPDPSIALELIRRGVYVNIIQSHSRNPARFGWRGGKSESVLDIVRGQKQLLREYKSPTASVPELDQGMDAAMSELQEGTWQHAAVKVAADRSRRNNRRKLEEYNKEIQRIANLKGVQAKQAAIDSALLTLEQIESEVLTRGGKTFEELHPGVEQQKDTRQVPWQQPRESPGFRAKVSFFLVSDLTEQRVAKYIELFEAAWAGDLDKIKALTLVSWDPENHEPPLQIAVHDSNSSSPFSLAYFRGYHDIAKAILDIAQAQYVAEEKPPTRYRMQTGGDASDSEDDSSDFAEPMIYSEVVDQQSTIENVGQVSMLVKSRVNPLTMLGWDTPSIVIKDGKVELTESKHCLLKHAILNNDRKSLRSYYDFAVYLATQRKQTEESSRYEVFPQWAFWLAIERGFTEILTDMINWTGAGLPLEQLVRKTGVELKEIPRSYQGLTVYGIKRKDWAAAGQQVISQSTESGTSPLLYAAQKGSIESVEWLLSDAPLRHYLEYGKSEAMEKDMRLMHLSQSLGGFEWAVTRWLGAQNDLVLHAAIMGPNDSGAERLVKYLIRAHPASLEAKDSEGMSPLALAALLGRLDLVNILVAHGANQTTKDKKWNNLVHQALTMQPKAPQLRAMLVLLDPGLLGYLLKERSSLQLSDGRTPLHRWIGSLRQSSGDALEQNLEELRLLLETSSGGELEALDGGGDTPLHTLIRNREHPSIIKEVLQVNPRLLFRENAVGRTPAELAHDMFVRACVQPPVDRRYQTWCSSRSVADTLLQKTPEQFAQGMDAQESLPMFVDLVRGLDDLPRVRQIHDLVNEFANTYPGKRRLVSLNEANDVARRIGETYQGQRYGWTGFEGRKTHRRTASWELNSGELGNEEPGSESQIETGDFVSITLPGVRATAWS